MNEALLCAFMEKEKILNQNSWKEKTVKYRKTNQRLDPKQSPQQSGSPKKKEFANLYARKILETV